ncbi:unnamed protein product [Prunus armeniaca]
MLGFVWLGPCDIVAGTLYLRQGGQEWDRRARAWCHQKGLGKEIARTFEFLGHGNQRFQREGGAGLRDSCQEEGFRAAGAVRQGTQGGLICLRQGVGLSAWFPRRSGAGSVVSSSRELGPCRIHWSLSIGALGLELRHDSLWARSLELDHGLGAQNFIKETRLGRLGALIKQIQQVGIWQGGDLGLGLGELSCVGEPRIGARLHGARPLGKKCLIASGFGKAFGTGQI